MDNTENNIKLTRYGRIKNWNNEREYIRLYYHDVIKPKGAKTCQYCNKVLACQSSLIKHQKKNIKCRLKKMELALQINNAIDTTFNNENNNNREKIIY